MLANSTVSATAALTGLRDALAWPMAAAWPEDRPLGDWRRAGSVAYRAPPLRTAYGSLLNHRAALAALGDAVHAAPYKAPPKAPVLYIKPRNCFAGHGDAVVMPADADELYIGATLGIIIGRDACRVGEAEALSLASPATPSATMSACRMRPYYRPSCASSAATASCRSARGSSPPGNVPDPDALGVHVASTAGRAADRPPRLAWRPVARLIAEISAFMTLAAGDLLMLGVPAAAPRARAGQRVQITIDGIGTLENPFVAESPS